jgi:hypothetical protein
LQPRKSSRKERKFRKTFAKIRKKNALPPSLKSVMSRSSERTGLHDEIQIALGVSWLDRPLVFPLRTRD